MASVDEDTELRELVAQTLENNGVLGKIKAQLRSSIFLALEDRDSAKIKVPFANTALKNYLDTQNGILAHSIILDYLNHFKLEFTKAVFLPECSTKTETVTDIKRHLAIPPQSFDSNQSYLGNIIAYHQGSRQASSFSDNINEALTEQQVSTAKSRFSYYDEDRDGLLDKEQLRCLFIDLFPAFDRNMLECYVNNEFRAAGRDFGSMFVGSGVNVTEFIDMYRRFHLQCKSVLCSNPSDVTNIQQLLYRPKTAKIHSLFDEIQDKKTKNMLDGNGKIDSDFMNDAFFDDLLLSSSGQMDPLLQSDSKVAKKPLIEKTETLNLEDSNPQDNLLDKGSSQTEDILSEKQANDFSSPKILSARNDPKSLPEPDRSEDVDEEIEEDISVECDDLLKSQSSIAGVDDVTTDRTISQDIGYDYAEDLTLDQ